MAGRGKPWAIFYGPRYDIDPVLIRARLGNAIWWLVLLGLLVYLCGLYLYGCVDFSPVSYVCLRRAEPIESMSKRVQD